MVIANGYEIAKQVAKIALDCSMTFGRDSKLDDVMLFGSTWKEGQGNDIDLLLIHSLFQLNDFGKITKYNEETARAEIDYERKFEDKPYRASSILCTLESKQIHEWWEFTSALVDIQMGPEYVTRPNSDWRPTRRHNHVKKIDAEDFVFQYARIVEPVDFFAGAEKEYQRIRGKYDKQRVITQVEILLEAQGLKVNEALDIQAMYKNMLSSTDEHTTKERRNAIRQCRDPTFWQSILQEGRLYNAKEDNFSIPVTDKYPNALQLFDPRQI